MTQIVTPTLSEVLRTAVESYFERFFTTLVCRVESYDATLQEADLVPVTLVKIYNTEGELVKEELPKLANVPVAFPRAGDWFVSMPVAVGDTMVALIAARDFDDWREFGEDRVAEDVRVNPLSAAIAFPCNLYPKSEPLTNNGSTHMVMGNDSGIRAYFRNDGLLHLGEATDYVALAQMVLTELTSLQTQINALITIHNANAVAFAAHTHNETGVVTLGPNSAFAAATPITAPNSVACNKVKAE